MSSQSMLVDAPYQGRNRQGSGGAGNRGGSSYGTPLQHGSTTGQRFRHGDQAFQPTRGSVVPKALAGNGQAAVTLLSTRGSQLRAAAAAATSRQSAGASSTARGSTLGRQQRQQQQQRRVWGGFLGVALAASIALSATVLHSTLRPGAGRVPAVVGVDAVPNEQLSFRPDAEVRMLAVVPDGVSPFGGASWPEVGTHMRQRMEWFSARFDVSFLTESQISAPGGEALLHALAQEASAVVAFQVRQPSAVDALKQLAGDATPGLVLLGLDGDASLEQMATLAGYRPAAGPGPLAKLLPWMDTAAKRGAKVFETVAELYSRHNSDDLLYIFLVLANAYVEPVPEVANSIDGTSLSTLACMLTNCGSEVITCVRDDGCKKALDCLQGCKFNDQVCSYLCIASYESPLLEAFSLCILQKHNCLGLDAQPPTRPDPAPLASFRGMEMSHELAEDIFIGWFDANAGGADGNGSAGGSGGGGAAEAVPAGARAAPGGKRFSWRVAAGKNPAYDAFPDQYQLFYRGQARGSFWYDPIFRVITLDGQVVWRERHYRVRRAKVPGTFHLSVLDNGVVSKEFWRILDADEDLAWSLFYYTGAASVAGVSYSGAILATRDGSYPDDMTRVDAALDRAGIKRWELSSVANSAEADAPLRPIAKPAEAQLLVLG